MTATMALNMSKTAYQTGKKARHTQEGMFASLSEMTSSAEEAMKLANETSRKVQVAMDVTKSTLEDAKKVFDEATKPIVDSGIALIRGKARYFFLFGITLERAGFCRVVFQIFFKFACMSLLLINFTSGFHGFSQFFVKLNRTKQRQIF